MTQASNPGGGNGRPRAAFPASLSSVVSAVGTPRATAQRVPTAFATAQRVALAGLQSPSGVGMDSQAVRLAMVKKLVGQGLTSLQVQEAFLRVERHRFVDSALVAQAYEDTSLPIGLGQTISKPSVVGRMLELLCEGRDQPLGRVLEIGTGCGYQAALMAGLAKEVYSIERLRGLHEKARENLRPMRLPNVHLIFGDGMLGFPSGAPYAGIVSAAGGESIPDAWLEQLAVGGRLVAPAELTPGKQSLVVIDRTPAGFTRQVLESVLFVPLKSGLA